MFCFNKCAHKTNLAIFATITVEMEIIKLWKLSEIVSFKLVVYTNPLSVKLNIVCSACGLDWIHFIFVVQYILSRANVN